MGGEALKLVTFVRPATFFSFKERTQCIKGSPVHSSQLTGTDGLIHWTLDCTPLASQIHIPQQ